MKVLIIDNYDSFTYNLAQLVAAASGSDPVILYNDAVSESELRKLDFDAVVLSPGPGRPERRRDFGLCETILKEFRKPVLGVCLGHQGIGHFSGGTVTHAPEPMHGRLSKIRHNGRELFKGIMSPFNAVRYHSLIVSDLPDCIEVDATTEDGLVMGMHHKELPLWGVQFHPESIASEYGDRIIGNFLELAEAWLSAQVPEDVTGRSPAAPAAGETMQLKPVFKELKTDLGSETCFEILYGNSRDAYWLDSSSHARQQGRYSFMGDASGPYSETVSYDVNTGLVDVARSSGPVRYKESIFDYVDRRIRGFDFRDTIDIPVPFKGGYVGYLGYELKADCGGRNAHRSRQADARMIFADRFVAFDHQFHQAWLVCLVKPGEEDKARNWFKSVETRLAGSYLSSKPARSGKPEKAPSADQWVMRHTREAYLDRINRSLREITDGETYEVCLCNEWTKSYDKRPLGTYQALRTINPAPYSAFLRFDKLSVLSCSPERMVRISKDGLVNCKPIKGTIARSKSEAEDTVLKETLYTSEKDRAENLMIVDLIRNDLNKVCRTGTVAVPKLCAIESFATVHQMVSTVTGELRKSETAVSCVRSLFPGGSMTGAPKIRTMEIIDELEGGARGIYSGAIGYFSMDGSVDLNIVIRTIVLNGTHASVGAGGAIIALSDPVSEFDETMLKGEVLRSALLTLDPAEVEVVSEDTVPAAAK